ncbi:hypothetical protein K443DRAFT_93661 [Laccaria amethystina LaAM-08-1]|uniref:Uncharacterized protein n=1 Tax=Laccaria amethystina LaAM-08-1 TaxID=1095629 RepID=A0A0C9XR87_9AGAR|nr:hypothetical protein K443DRAFT_93661 [Laccaria amethystina LaAM-08-1]
MSSTRRITRNSPSKPGSSQKWRSASLVDSYSDNSSDGTLCDTEIQIDDLDEACSITFKTKDHVWVRTQEGNWLRGTVSGTGKEKPLTRHANRTGTYYPVVFGTNSNVRKYFSPLNGEIKPDSEDVRDLLIRDGWLETEEDKVSWLLSR